MLGSVVPMNVLKISQVALATCVCLVGASRLASAEIVFMTSGGTLSVKSHVTSGDTVTLTLRAGGEVTCDNPLLVQALIQVESNYQPRARSSKGAMGLMQLMPSVARQYRVRNAYDPAANIDAGVRKLKSLIDTWGTELALAAYNAGEGAVAKFNGVPPYRETQKYVSRILAIAGRK